MKRKMKIVITILLSISIVFSLSGCHRKHFISGTFYSDDYDERTYQFIADGNVKSNGAEQMSYEYISGNKYILHLDKADLVCEYNKELEIITYKYDGKEFHLYNDYVTAEKSRKDRGHEVVTEVAMEPPNPEDYRQETSVQEPPSEEAPTEATETATTEKDTPDKTQEEKNKTDKETVFDAEAAKSSLQGTWKVKGSDISITIKDAIVTQVVKDKAGKESKVSYELVVSEKGLTFKSKDGKTTNYEYSLSKNGKELTLTGASGSTLYVKE